MGFFETFSDQIANSLPGERHQTPRRFQFSTQTGGEFSLTPETKTIADLCSLTMLHRVDEAADQLADWFGLSDREANWARTAKAGDKDAGYSEALLGIDEEGWFPLRIRASPAEQTVIEAGDVQTRGDAS